MRALQTHALDRLAAMGEDGASARQTLDNERVHGTTAWKKGQVIYPQTKHIYIDIGGPASLRHSLEELKTAFAKSRRPQIGAATTARSRAC
ncbi:hypothetical protein [Cardiobacterium hominis]|uniref:hypothetical protein n=1 Tax=Cardiobacterium hominis TaxID=2718 RepID=UPI0028D136CB|nr:hypothetical protein [Cardiobacterium hominis]